MNRALPAGALLVQCALLGRAASGAEGEDLRAAARAALRKAVTFFRSEVSAQGGYLWRYSEDLRLREGEVEAGATTVWVQPPGTPSVGLACLEAHRATGEALFLDAARDAARVLVRGQLRSGGWTYRIELEPADRRRHAYRVDRPPEKQHEKQRNVSTLDDSTTQAALLLLMRADRALGFKDAEVHQAALQGLDSLLKAQYPSGGFPQGYDGPVDAGTPVRQANLPASWSREWPGGKEYWRLYTLNDDLLPSVLEVLVEAARIYGEARFREAASRAGEFVLRAQLPEPQPAWAQQYDLEMRPAWARKFEPPAVTGGESQGVLLALLELHRETGEARWLEPIPRALAYLRRCLLPDGRLARFYELGTNRPLYFTRDYRLTHEDGDPPQHYAFKVEARLERIEREHRRALEAKGAKEAKGQAAGGRAEPSPPLEDLARRARRAVETLDARGRWVEEGRLKGQPAGSGPQRIIDCRSFNRNVEALARYLRADPGDGDRR